MKVNEKILKYFSEQMSADEKTRFEAELKNNEELKVQYERFSLQLGELKSTKEPELNEAYFINLIPRVHARIEKAKHKTWVPKFALVLPVIAIIAIILFYFKDANNYTRFLAELPDSSKIQIVNYIEKDKQGLSDYYLKDTSAQEVVESEIEKNIDVKDLNLDRRICYTDNYDIINSLSGDEVDKIYDKMLSKKIL
jgi:hypothetical protein